MIPASLTTGLVDPAPPTNLSKDPFWNAVTHLYHCDGSEGSTSFLNSKTATTVTATSVTNKAANARYGTRGAAFVANGIIPMGSMSIPTAFTYEMWLYPSGSPTFCGITATNAGAMVIGYRTGSQFGIGIQGTGFFVYGAIPTAGQWNHVVVQRDPSNVVSIYINGIRTAKGTFTQTFGSNLAYRVEAGSAVSKAVSMDEIRFTRNVARYTTTTIPVPTQAYPNT